MVPSIDYPQGAKITKHPNCKSRNTRYKWGPSLNFWVIGLLVLTRFHLIENAPMTVMLKTVGMIRLYASRGNYELDLNQRANVNKTIIIVDNHRQTMDHKVEALLRTAFR